MLARPGAINSSGWPTAGCADLMERQAFRAANEVLDEVRIGPFLRLVERRTFRAANEGLRGPRIGPLVGPLDLWAFQQPKMTLF